MKPASKTPLTMLYLAVVLRESGLPDGVLSVLPTANASVISDLLDDPRLRKLTFTGSTEVGQQLAAKAAQHTTRVSLELGGNAPYIVLDDAAVDLAAREVAVAKMRGAGQVCIAANRFLVHESLVDEFVPAVVEQMKSFTMGPGYEDGVTLGALSGRIRWIRWRNSSTMRLSQARPYAWAGFVRKGRGRFTPPQCSRRFQLSPGLPRRRFSAQ